MNSVPKLSIDVEATQMVSREFKQTIGSIQELFEYQQVTSVEVTIVSLKIL